MFEFLAGNDSRTDNPLTVMGVRVHPFPLVTSRSPVQNQEKKKGVQNQPSPTVLFMVSDLLNLRFVYKEYQDL